MYEKLGSYVGLQENYNIDTSTKNNDYNDDNNNNNDSNDKNGKTNGNVYINNNDKINRININKSNINKNELENYRCNIVTQIKTLMAAICKDISIELIDESADEITGDKWINADMISLIDEYINFSLIP